MRETKVRQEGGKGNDRHGVQVEHPKEGSAQIRTKLLDRRREEKTTGNGGIFRTLREESGPAGVPEAERRKRGEKNYQKRLRRNDVLKGGDQREVTGENLPRLAIWK